MDKNMDLPHAVLQYLAATVLVVVDTKWVTKRRHRQRMHSYNHSAGLTNDRFHAGALCTINKGVSPHLSWGWWWSPWSQQLPEESLLAIMGAATTKALDLQQQQQQQ